MYCNRPNLPNRPILSISDLRLKSARNYDSGLSCNKYYTTPFSFDTAKAVSITFCNSVQSILV